MLILCCNVSSIQHNIPSFSMPVASLFYYYISFFLYIYILLLSIPSDCVSYHRQKERKKINVEGKTRRNFPMKEFRILPYSDVCLWPLFLVRRTLSRMSLPNASINHWLSPRKKFSSSFSHFTIPPLFSPPTM